MDKGRPVSELRIPPARTAWLVWLITLALLAWLLAHLLATKPAPVVATAPPAETTAPAAPAPAAAPVPAIATAPAAPEPAPQPAAIAPAAPTPAATTPAAPEPAAPAGDPLVVEGLDLRTALGGALQSITRAFAGITDPASARAALPRLTEARDTLSGLEETVTALPQAGRSALKQMIAGAMPGILIGAERLKADGPVNAVTGPVIGDILARLSAFAA